MAGSKKWFVYTDDAGTDHAILLDESNTEAVNGTTGAYPGSGGPADSIPKNVKPREIFYTNSSRTRTIRTVALTPAIYSSVVTARAAIVDPIAGSGNNLILGRANGERRRYPSSIDTGLNDGDQ